MSSRPQCMFKQGCGPDNNFASDEKLYFRIHKECIMVDQDDGTIELNEDKLHVIQSCNRSKDCDYPYSVLYGENLDVYHHDCGYGEMLVQDIPESQITSGDVKYSYSVTHVPLENVYPHSELQIFKNDNFEEAFTKKPKNSYAWETYKIRIAESISIIQEPRDT